MGAIRSSIWNHTLALAGYRDGTLHPLGSAFLIRHGWAITATHVLWEEKGAVSAGQIIHGQREPLQWSVKHLYTAPSVAEARPHDLALLELEALHPQPELEHYRRYGFKLNFASPRVGQAVKAYGYTKSTASNPSGDGLIFEIMHDKNRVSGIVTDNISPYRDMSMLPFPCFSIDADFSAGMSGGPIFNEEMEVCGIVSSGGIVGWGSALWPALAINYNGRFLLDDAMKGLIQSRNHQCVSFDIDEYGQAKTITFDPNRMR